MMNVICSHTNTMSAFSICRFFLLTGLLYAEQILVIAIKAIRFAMPGRGLHNGMGFTIEPLP